MPVAARLTPNSTRSLRLDAVRGSAALLVMLYHAFMLGTPSGSAAPELWMRLTQQFMQHGWGGVPVFFVLSGFLLTRIALQADHFETRSFLLRRARRLLPGYWMQWLLFALLFAAGWQVAGTRITTSAADLFVQPLMLYQLWPGAPRAWLDVWWSLPVEAAFYLLFPWLIGLIRRNRHAVLLGLLAISPIVRYLPGALWPESRWPFVLTAHLPGHFDLFLIGMLAAGFVSTSVDNPLKLAARHAATPCLALAWLLALIWLPALLQLPSARFTVTLLPLAFWNSLFACGVAVLLCALSDRDARDQPVAWPLRQLAGVGTVSYGLYLWHLPVLALLAPWAGSLGTHPLRGLVLLAVALLPSLGLAWLSWILVESRWIRPASA